MKRRDVIGAGVTTALFSLMPITSAFAGANFIKYNREICNSLDKLVDYKTGKPFEQDSFAVVYFSTPYNAFEDQGFSCDSDLLYISQAIKVAEYSSKQKIIPILVISPLESGDPNSDIAKKFTDPSRGNFTFIGLTGDRQSVFDVSKDYRSPFKLKSGKIIGHERFAILISPDGELLSKYFPSNLSRMSHDIVNNIKSYDADEIAPTRKFCDP